MARFSAIFARFATIRAVPVGTSPPFSGALAVAVFSALALVAPGALGMVMVVAVPTLDLVAPGHHPRVEFAVHV